MPLIVIASTNPAKTQPTKEAFELMFPGEAFEVEEVGVVSGVNEQPKSDTETLQGAMNRVEAVRKQFPNADYWVGIEGGIEQRGKDTMAFAWAVVVSKEQIGKGKGGEFLLPAKVVKLVKEGKTLGEADDIVFARTDSNKNSGAVGLLTSDIVTRSDFHRQAFILALIPFKNKDLYSIND